jgi:hypothetical protein
VRYARQCFFYFTMATSSAASERNFSTFGFIHSKLRNFLSNGKVEKLVFMKQNYPAFAESLLHEYNGSPQSESDYDSSCEHSNGTVYPSD